MFKTSRGRHARIRWSWPWRELTATQAAWLAELAAEGTR